MPLIAPDQDYYIGLFILAILVGLLLVMVLIWFSQMAVSVFNGIEMGFMFITKRPVFIYFHPFLNKLTPKQESILKQQFTFYNRLNKRKKRSEEHTSELQSRENLVCRLLLEK